MPIGLAAGEQVGDYIVQSLRATGGQASVYVAHHFKTAECVALKVSHTPLDQQLHERWLRDANLTHGSTNKYLARNIDRGIEHGVPWSAWEFLEGHNLQEYVDIHGPQPIETCAPLLSQICAGIRELHVRDIVHCDLSPRNVFICRPSSTGEVATVKLLDFGLAKILTESLQGSTNFVAGSPLWMAPEQMHGRASVERQTDVWTFALLTFFMLVGDTFWAPEGNIMRYMNRVLFEPAQTASARAAELGSNVKLPADFDRWFAKCTARKPEARFDSISEAWRDCQRVFGLAQDGTTLRAPSTEPRRPRTSLRTKIIGGTAAFGLGLIVAASVARPSLGNAPPPVRSLTTAKPSALATMLAPSLPNSSPDAPVVALPPPPSSPPATSACPSSPGRPSRYVLGGGTLQVAQIPYEGRSDEETLRLAVGRLKKLGAVLRARGATDWLRTIGHYKGRDKRTVERVVFNDVAPQAGEAMCRWLQCENWQWGCDFVDKKGQRGLVVSSFPESASISADSRAQDP